MSARRKEKQRHVIPVVVQDIGNGYMVWCPTLTGVWGSGIT
jgi:hypothetical protein